MQWTECTHKDKEQTDKRWFEVCMAKIKKNKTKKC